MKPGLRNAVLAAALGIALPAANAELIKVNGQVPPVVDAVQSAWRELQQADDSQLPAAARLERVADYRFTQPTADKLRAVFGTDRPYRLERRPAGKGGGANWHASLQPLHYQSAPGAGVDWDEATADIGLDKAGKNVDVLARWNSFSAGDGNTRITARGLTMSVHQKQGFAGMWFGTRNVKIASVIVDGKTERMTMDDIGVDWRSVERAQSAEVGYAGRIGSLGVAGEKIEDVRFGLRLTNIDKQVLADMDAATKRERGKAASNPAPTPGQQLEIVKPYLRSFIMSALKRDTALDVDEFSARYHGQKVSLRGRVSLAGLSTADLVDFKGLANKVVARFELRVPVALVREIGGAIAARQMDQMAARNHSAPNQQSIEQLRQSAGDIVIGKLVGEGYAKLENDVLVSTLEYRGGALTANGKPIQLPKPQANAPGAPVDAPPPAAANAMQARRIEDSCRLPDYPADVVQGDLALRAMFAFRIDAQGAVRDVRVASPSSFPDWDQAALQALARCRYIPALLDGKPVEMQSSWNLKRESGSRYPFDPNPAR